MCIENRFVWEIARDGANGKGKECFSQVIDRDMRVPHPICSMGDRAGRRAAAVSGGREGRSGRASFVTEEG